jgi:hypothetical protein
VLFQFLVINSRTDTLLLVAAVSHDLTCHYWSFVVCDNFHCVLDTQFITRQTCKICDCTVDYMCRTKTSKSPHAFAMCSIRTDLLKQENEKIGRRFARYVHVKNWNYLFYCSNITKSENAMLWRMLSRLETLTVCRFI